MSEHTATSSGNGGARLAAHERMSTGALARWARALRDAPVARPRVVARDHRGPHRPRRHGRRRAPGRVRDPRLRHAACDRPDRVGVRVGAGRRAQHRLRGARGRAPRHAGAQGSDRAGDGEAPRRAVRRGEGRRARRRRSEAVERRRPVQRADLLEERAHRLRRGAVRPDDRGQGPRRGGRRRRCRAGGRGARRRDGRVQRRGGVPADQAGDVRAARPARGADRAADRVPHVRRRVHPDHARDRGAGDRVPPPLHPRRLDRHQHRHADPRVDDRARRRDRLLAVHRHALPAVPPRGARAARRGRGGRRVGRPRGAVRRADGRDLGDRARVLRPRLRDEARDRERARRPDDGAACELVPARRPRAARPQGRPAQGAVPARRSTTRKPHATGLCSRAGAGS